MGYLEYLLIKFNPLNPYQYFISSSKSFKVFDIRNYNQIEEIEELKGSVNVYNDTTSFLKLAEDEVSCYRNEKGKIELLKNYSITGISSFCLNEDKNLFLGLNNGDFYASYFNNSYKTFINEEVSDEKNNNNFEHNVSEEEDK